MVLESFQLWRRVEPAPLWRTPLSRELGGGAGCNSIYLALFRGSSFSAKPAYLLWEERSIKLGSLHEIYLSAMVMEHCVCRHSCTTAKRFDVTLHRVSKVSLLFNWISDFWLWLCCIIFYFNWATGNACKQVFKLYNRFTKRLDEIKNSSVC